jgi:hypothetical protein
MLWIKSYYLSIPTRARETHEHVNILVILSNRLSPLSGARTAAAAAPPLVHSSTYLSRHAYIQHNGNNINNNNLPNSAIHHLPNSVNIHAGLYKNNYKNKILTTAPYGYQVQSPSPSRCLSRSLGLSRSRSHCLSPPSQMEPNSESKSVPSRNHCLSRSLSRSLSLSHLEYWVPACGTHKVYTRTHQQQ